MKSVAAAVVRRRPFRHGEAGAVGRARLRLPSSSMTQARSLPPSQRVTCRACRTLAVLAWRRNGASSMANLQSSRDATSGLGDDHRFDPPISSASSRRRPGRAAQESMILFRAHGKVTSPSSRSRPWDRGRGGCRSATAGKAFGILFGCLLDVHCALAAETAAAGLGGDRLSTAAYILAGDRTYSPTRTVPRDLADVHPRMAWAAARAAIGVGGEPMSARLAALAVVTCAVPRGAISSRAALAASSGVMRACSWRVMPAAAQQRLRPRASSSSCLSLPWPIAASRHPQPRGSRSPGVVQLV